MLKFYLIFISIILSFVSSAQRKFEDEIIAFEKSDKISLPASGGLLLTGSSTIRLWDNYKKDLHPFNVLNRGFGGSTMQDLLFYFDRIIVPYKPKIMIVYEGDNDLAAEMPVEKIINDFSSFTEKMKTKLPETKFAFLSVKPTPGRSHLLPEQITLNKKIKTLCYKTSNCTFLDIFTPLLDEQNMPRIELFKEDKIHLNPMGYQICAQIIINYLKEQNEK